VKILVSSFKGCIESKSRGTLMRNIILQQIACAVHSDQLIFLMAFQCSLLCSRHTEEAGYAAGVIQNLSRHKKARLLLQGQAVSLLIGLALTSTHLPAQVAAVCALHNLLSPALGSGFSGFKRRRLLKNVLSDALALGMIGSAVLTTNKAMSPIAGGWTALALPAFRTQIAALEGVTQSVAASEVEASDKKYRDARHLPAATKAERGWTFACDGSE